MLSLISSSESAWLSDVSACDAGLSVSGRRRIACRGDVARWLRLAWPARAADRRGTILAVVGRLASPADMAGRVARRQAARRGWPVPASLRLWRESRLVLWSRAAGSGCAAASRDTGVSASGRAGLRTAAVRRRRDRDVSRRLASAPRTPPRPRPASRPEECAGSGNHGAGGATGFQRRLRLRNHADVVSVDVFLLAGLARPAARMPRRPSAAVFASRSSSRSVTISFDRSP